MGDAEADGAGQEAPENQGADKPWTGTSVDEPPYDPHPPERPAHLLSTTRKVPRWTMHGRGDEQVIEYTLTSSQVTTFVRARLMKTRPVPDTAQEPHNFMTHQIEYIVGGGGKKLEWVRLDEAKKLVRQSRQKMGDKSAEGEAYCVVPYKFLESESAQQPAPGQYSVCNSASCLPPHSQTVVMGTTKRFTNIYEKRPKMPDPATYTVRLSKSSPSFGFGSAPRIPPVRRDSGPEPGAYQPRNCWNASRVTMRGRQKERAYEEVRGLDPMSYDAAKGLRLTQTKEPAWPLGTTGKRSEAASSCLPEKVGPGTYDISMKLVTHRSPAVTYTKPKGNPLKPGRASYERPLSHFSSFAGED